jgi:hypothetical protein
MLSDPKPYIASKSNRDKKRFEQVHFDRLIYLALTLEHCKSHSYRSPQCYQYVKRTTRIRRLLLLLLP